MSRLAVTGYASLDYPVGLAGMAGGDRTTLIDHRDPAAWPRVGGCAAYIAKAVAAGGCEVCAVTWVGGDENGVIYVEDLERAGVDVAGVNLFADRSSPLAVMVYQGDGSCACLFDPAFTGEEALSDSQREKIAAADHLCVSVGPPHLMDDILDARAPGASLYWVLKSDEHCFTVPIRARLSGEADVIFCNQAERRLVGKTSGGAVLVETSGPAQIRIEHGGGIEALSAEPITVRDTTGAGDTFAGGFIAARMSGVDEPARAARAGIDAVRSMLERRKGKEGG